MWLTILLLAATAKPITLPVHFHLAPAEAGEGATVDDAWLATQIRQANAIFAPRGLQFAQQSRSALPAKHAVADSRRDRNALGRFLKPKVINVFVVRALRDIHDRKLWRQGVHWRPFGRKKGPKGHVRHQVILSAQAGTTVLAHELGHFFGHPKHTQTRGNLMSYNRGKTLPFLDAKQGRRMFRTARRFVRTRELVPVAAASPLSKPAR